MYYLRNKDGQEVDFAVADRKKIWLLVEAKEGDVSLSKNLVSLSEKVGSPPSIQVVHKKKFCVQKGKHLYVMGADYFLNLLP